MLFRSSHPPRFLHLATAAVVLVSLLLCGCGRVGTTVNGDPSPFAIMTTALPAAQAGSPYSTTLQASGGTAPYTWSLAGGTLPQGLLLNTSSGTLSGTPIDTAPGTVTLTFSATDSGSSAQSLTVTVSLSIKPKKLRVLTTSLPGGTAGVPYSATLSAIGGVGRYTWTLVSGTLPAGLTLNATTGAITGSPAPAAGNQLTFQVSDSETPAQTSTVTVALNITLTGGALSVTSTSLPAGQVGVAYATTLTASGGTAPYTWALTKGVLPAGLSLNNSGAITGTPTAVAAATSLTFTVRDSGAFTQSNTGTFSLTIAPATLRITSASLPNGQVGVAYTATLAATGGTTPYTWTLVSGALPAGLTLNAATGAITGTPSAAVSGAPLTFKVTDAGVPAQTATAILHLTIAPVTLRITSASLPNGQVGVAYTATLAATGGTTPYNWTLTAGTLPAGLALNAATGAITGTPSAAVSGASLTFKVTDAGAPAQTATVILHLTIAPVTLRITSASLPNGQVGVAYTATLAATGGTTPYNWTLVSGALPAGLSLNAATGAITGTPSAAVAGASLTFKVTDAGTPAQSASVALTLTITSASLRITTASLPNGQVGVAYTATLAATGGTTPYTWMIASGVLPTGLSLNTSTGAITGTPTVAVSGSSISFKVTDSSAPAQSASATLTLTINSNTLAITTTSLPSGQVGVAYTATLAATGGTTPYKWTLAAGTLPAGLSLSAAGVISGVPTAAVTAAPLTVQVTDSGSPTQSKTANLTLTVSVNVITVSAISPKTAALTITQALKVSATTNDAAGVNWSVSPTGGSISPTTSLSGAPVTLTAPGTAGLYTLTATSVTDPTKSTSIKVAVTDLAAVLTYHNDIGRDGANTQEYGLTPATVTSNFGKLFSCPVDGAVYAQPLWLANLQVAGVKRNVLFVATQHDSVYAFDADANPCAQLWKVSLIDAAHGATSGEQAVPYTLVGKGAGDIAPEVGVTGTPVIDPVAGILYVVAKSVDATGTTFYQRLHAIDLATGNRKTGSPIMITGSYPGTGDGGTTVTFNPQQQNQRPALALVNGQIYLAWGSHADLAPWYGWMMSYQYNGSAFTQTAVLNVSPNAQESGIWMSGGAPAADPAGHLYITTGNGIFDANSSTAPTNDYGDTMLQVTAGLTTSSYFTPSSEQTDYINDYDFGSGGVVVLNVPAGSPAHLVVGGNKDGQLYLLNGDSMGGFGDGNARQSFPATGGVFGTGAFWNNTFYIAPRIAALSAYAFNLPTRMFSPTIPTSHSSNVFIFPGATPSVSAQGSSNGIVWALDNSQYCTSLSPGCGPAVLYAYDATNLATQLWNSSLTGTDTAGNAVKFTVPTVANGKVYIGTRGNNIGGADSSTSSPGEVDVYGLKP